MTKEWATSQSVTVSMPSADSDKAFNDALRKLQCVLKDARALAMHEGLHGPTVDKILMRVIESYIDQIESEWS